MLQKAKDLFSKLPRSWALIVAAVIFFLFLLPGFDVKVVFRFVTFFAINVSFGWAALRLFWIERTKDIEEETEGKALTAGDATLVKFGIIRATIRDLSYAIMVTGSIVAAANISL